MENKKEILDSVNGVGTSNRVDTEVNSTTEEVTVDGVADATEHAAKSVDAVLDTADKARDAAVGDDKDGAPGVQTRARVNHLGAAKSMSADAVLAKTRAITALHTKSTIASDIDRYGENIRLAEGAYDKVVPLVDFEATRDAEEGVTQIVGNPNNNGVYSLESSVIEETIAGDTVKYPVNHPRHRSHGTEFHQNYGMLDVTGQRVFGMSKNTASRAVNIGDGGILLNKLNSAGRPERGSFVSPIPGKYWVKGWNPYAKGQAKNPHLKATTVKIKNEGATAKFFSSTAAAGSEADITIYTVDYETSGNMHPFQVIDISTQYADITSAVDAIARVTNANKTRMIAGMSEALESLCATAMMSLDAEQQRVYPELNDSLTRTTLFEGDREGSGISYACHNSVESVLTYIHQLMESDVMWATIPATMKNIGKDVLFMKGFEGNNSSQPYFRRHSGKSTRQRNIGAETDADKNIHVPNLTPYARSLSSHAAFNTAGKWATGFRDFKARVNTILTEYKESPFFQTVLGHVMTLDTVMQELNYIFSYGRVTESEGMTSNAVAKLPGMFDIILDIDPNSLIDSDTTGIQAKWYPVAGYTNFTGDMDTRYADPKTYSLIPTWLEALIEYQKTAAFDEVFCHDLSSTTYGRTAAQSAGTLTNWCFPASGSPRWIPIQVDAFKGSLFPFILADAYLNINEKAYGAHRTKNALTNRWYDIFDKIGAEKVLCQHYDTDMYKICSSILDNADFDVNPKVQKVANLPMLYASARERFLNRRMTRLGCINLHDNGTGFFNAAGDAAAWVYAPDELMEFIQNNKSITAYRVMLGGTAPFGTDAGTEAFNEADILGPCALIDELQKIDDTFKTALAAAKPGDIVPVTEIVFKLGKVKDDIRDSSIVLSSRVAQFGADEAYLGVSETVEAKLYEHDSHFFNQGDGYVLCVEVPEYPDGATTNNDFSRANIALCPFRICNGSYASKWMAGQGTATTASVAISGIGDNTITAAVNILPREVVANRILMTPSLYGTQYEVTDHITAVRPNYVGRGRSDSDRWDDDMIYAYAFSIGGVNVGTDVNLQNALAASSRDLGDPSHLYEQILYTNAYNQDTAGTVMRGFTLDAFYAIGGWMIPCAMHHAALTRIAAAKHDDQLRRLLNYRNSSLYDCVQSVPATINNALLPFRYNYAVDYTSSDSFNDLRRYVVDKPLHFYEKQAHTYGMITSLLYKQYTPGK